MEPAVIGAASALAGVVVSQFFSMLQGVLERKQKHTALMREKLEELADNLHQTTHYADSLLKPIPVRGYSQSQEAHHALSLSAEARRVYVLSLLYFSPLKEQAGKLLQSLITLYSATTSHSKVDEKQLRKAANDYASSKTELELVMPAKSSIINNLTST